MLTITDLARRQFDAYNEEGPNPWKTWDGKDVPRWDAVTDQVRRKWEAAARQACTDIDHIRNDDAATVLREMSLMLSSGNGINPGDAIHERMLKFLALVEGRSDT